MPKRNEDEVALQKAIEESKSNRFMEEILRQEQQQVNNQFQESKDLAEVEDLNEIMNQMKLQEHNEQKKVKEAVISSNPKAMGMEEKGSDSNQVDNDAVGLNQEEEMEIDRLLQVVPEHLCRSMLLFLDEDSIGRALCTCKRWHRFGKHEMVFRALCERIYPVQSQSSPGSMMPRKGRSWYYMFRHRPRVRYNGFYVLKVAEIRKPVRTMWNNIPYGTIIETIYYRYLNFKRDGTVRYALETHAPSTMKTIFRKHLLEEEIESPEDDQPGYHPQTQLNHSKPQIYKGTYSVDHGVVRVSATLPHAQVEFKFEVLHGNYNRTLVLLEHASRSLKQTELCPHRTYEQYFEFIRVWDI